MPTRRCLPWVLLGLLPGSLSSAQEAPKESPQTVQCSQEPRCSAAVSAALELAATDRSEALRQLLLIYTEFPDPRLCFNLGSLYQQTGKPDKAASQYRQFLDSNVEQNPELLSKARRFLEQAERDAAAHPLAPPETQPPPQSSNTAELRRPETAQGYSQYRPDKPQAARPVWRIAIGSVLLGAGLLTAGFGTAALSQNGQCLRFSSAGLTAPPCLQVVNTQAIGAGLLATGLLLGVGGVITIAIPSRRKATSVATALADIGPGLTGY